MELPGVRTGLRRPKTRIKSRGGKSDTTLTNRVVSAVIRHEKKMQSRKFFDTWVQAQSVGSGGTITPLCGIAQGVSQSERVADSTFMDALKFTYELVQINADTYSDTRVIIFQWHLSTQISTIVLADILYNTAGIGLYSQFNWPLRTQYTILYDKIHSQAGSTTSLTVTSNVNVHNKVITNFAKKLVFQPNSVNGTEQLFALFISDSAATPFPLINFSSRVVFHDED